MRKNWREITNEAEWRDMLNLTGLTPEQLRERYGVFFGKAEREPCRHRTTKSPHHRTLGLCTCASVEEIRSRYRALAMQHHPDHGGSVERMREINLAYTAICG
jgi:hypothetical protein